MVAWISIIFAWPLLLPLLHSEVHHGDEVAAPRFPYVQGLHSQLREVHIQA